MNLSEQHIAENKKAREEYLKNPVQSVDKCDECKEQKYHTCDYHGLVAPETFCKKCGRVPDYINDY